jgi:hypothetical protein
MPEGEQKPVEKPQESPGPWWFRPIGFVFGMKPEEQGRAVGLLLTAGAVGLVWFLLTQSTRLNDERFAMMMRIQQDDREKNRDDRTEEGERWRAVLKETTTLIIESNRQQALETGKLQATVAQFTAAVQEWTRQTQNLGSVIGKWKKDNEWPAPEAELAPMPKLWDRAPTGGRPTIG